MSRARHKQGSVVFNRRSGTWHYIWCENGGRRSRLIGNVRDFATKAAAWKKAENIRSEVMKPTTGLTTVNALAEHYKAERLPTRFSTARMYRHWLNNHILPKWGEMPITHIQPRDVELWLKSLLLSPKSRAHIRALMHVLFDYAMWSGSMDVQRNPIELVVVKGATKRNRQPHSLTVEQFQKVKELLDDPARTMACVAVCLGLRVSELLALKWSDIDWLNRSVTIQRAIVMNNVDDVKTTASRRSMTLDEGIIEMLKHWRLQTQFASLEDWVFASPAQIGRLPLSYTWFLRIIQGAATDAGVDGLGTHSFRHTYRSWLDAVGTPIAVQQKLMRHTDIRTTLNVYGDVVTNEMESANVKVADLALRKLIAN